MFDRLSTVVMGMYGKAELFLGYVEPLPKKMTSVFSSDSWQTLCSITVDYFLYD
jgi:hypothetical protein